MSEGTLDPKFLRAEQLDQCMADHGFPDAVVEVVSKGYEVKDFEIAPKFYLSQGVKDVVVFDPYTSEVMHVREGEVSRKQSPLKIELLCGCVCTV